MKYLVYYLAVAVLNLVVWTTTLLNLLHMALFEPWAIPRFWELYETLIKPEIAQTKKDIWKTINE